MRGGERAFYLIYFHLTFVLNSSATSVSGSWYCFYLQM